jgi:hypothetical protein
MINSHGVKQMQNNFHHKYRDHNLFSTHKTTGESIIKKTSVFYFKKIFKEVEKEMQNTTNALETQMDGVVMGAEISD